MRRTVLFPFIALCLAIFAAGGLSGCKSKQEKACAHMKDLMEEAVAALPAAEQEHAREGEDMANFETECMEHITRIQEQCSNPDDVLDCAAEATSMDAAEACEHVCQHTAEGTH